MLENLDARERAITYSSRSGENTSLEKEGRGRSLDEEGKRGERRDWELPSAAVSGISACPG